MVETLRTGPLAGRVAIVSGGGRGLGRSFCLALARQAARVVVNNRNRVVDADGHGPADHVADQITAAGGEAVAEYSDAADPGAGQAMVAVAPVLTALASKGCRLNGEYIVTGGGRLRPVGRGRRSRAPGPGARTHRGVGAPAGRAHLSAQPWPLQ